MIIILDSSQKIFIAESCLKDETIRNHLRRVIEKYQFPKQNVIEGVNLDNANTGDYLVRCIGGSIQVFQMEYLLNFGFRTKKIGEL